MKKTVSRLIFIIVLILLGVSIGLGFRYMNALNSKATIIDSQETFDQERERLEGTLEIEPGNLVAHLQLAELLYHYNRFDPEGAFSESLEHYNYILEDALNDSTTDPEVIAQLYFYIGNVYRTQEKFDDAITTFEKGLEYEPTHAALKYNIAYTYLNDLDNSESALDWLQRIGDDMADDPAYHYNLGRAYYEQGYYAEAESALEITMHLDPQNAPIVRGDLYRSVLEAQGRKLPKDADIVELEADYHIVNEDEE